MNPTVMDTNRHMIARYFLHWKTSVWIWNRNVNTNVKVTTLNWYQKSGEGKGEKVSICFVNCVVLIPSDAFHRDYTLCHVR